MRGSHHAPLMPVAQVDVHPSRFDGPTPVVCLGYQLHDGQLGEHRGPLSPTRPSIAPGLKLVR